MLLTSLDPMMVAHLLIGALSLATAIFGFLTHRKSSEIRILVNGKMKKLEARVADLERR